MSALRKKRVRCACGTENEANCRNCPQRGHALGTIQVPHLSVFVPLSAGYTISMRRTSLDGLVWFSPLDPGVSRGVPDLYPSRGKLNFNFYFFLLIPSIIFALSLSPWLPS